MLGVNSGFCICLQFVSLGSLGYLAAQAAASRGPLLYSGALSDGQFYSPPESFAGDECFCLFLACSDLCMWVELLSQLVPLAGSPGFPFPCYCLSKFLAELSLIRPTF